MSPCHELDDRPTLGRFAVRLTRVRFTLGRLMIAVAIVAIALGLGTAVYRRKERYLRLATHHQEQARAHFDKAWEYDNRGCLMGLERLTEEKHIEMWTRNYGPSAGWVLWKAYNHSHLSEAYRRAADRPWTAFILRSSQLE
jgi:hypothetical protein